MKITNIIPIIIFNLIAFSNLVFSQFSADVDGKLNISNVSGGLNYTYPLTNNTIDGYNLKFDLNYTSNASSIVLGEYFLDENEKKDGWSQLTITTPLWIMGVNGFAINALTEKHTFLQVSDICDTCEFVFHLPFEYIYDEPGILLVEGYDFNNRMKKLINNDDQDFIKILRADGSVLELRNPVRRKDVSSSNDPTLYTGFYYENSINPEGYAVVAFDSTYWPQYIKTVANGRSDRNSYIPRVLRYYRGDGLEYVFREIVTPYGLRAYQESIAQFDRNKRIPGNVTPTIFYLEEINSDLRNIAKFEREWHYPKANSNCTDCDTVELARGRAYITKFANHEITIGDEDIKIQVLDRTINCSIGEFDPESNNWNRKKEIYHDPELEKSISYDPYTFQLFHNKTRAYAFFDIYEITDPENRTTTFDYTPGPYHHKIYKNFGYPFDYYSYPKSALEKIYEPTKSIYLTYYQGDNTIDRYDLQSASPFDIDYDLTNVLKGVQTYESNGSNLVLLKTDSLKYNLVIDTDTLRSVEIRNKDNVSGLSNSTFYYYKLFRVTPFLVNDSQNYYTPNLTTMLPIKIINSYQDKSIKHKIFYNHYSDLGGFSRFNFLPIADSVMIEYDSASVIYQSKKVFEYNFTTINTFGGDTSLSHAFGQGISKSVEKILNPISGDTIVKNESYYTHLSISDLSQGRTDTLWNKIISINLTDSLVYLAGINGTSLKMDFVNNSNWILPPVWYIPTKELIKNAGDTILAGKSYYYNLEYSGNYRRGALLADSIIGKYGLQTKLNAKYNYSGGRRRNLLTRKEGLFGISSINYYSFSDVGSLGGSYPSGKKLYNNDDIDNVSLSHEFYEFESPVSSDNLVRKWANDNYTTDTLRTYLEKTYYGQNASMIDPNGWFWANEYDKNGRIKYAWYPFDFPPCNNNSVGVVTEIPLFNKHTTINFVYDRVSTTTQTITHPSNFINSSRTIPDFLEAGVEYSDLVPLNNDSITGNHNQRREEYSASMEYRATSNDPFHSGTDITSAYLRLAYSGCYASQCMTLKISSDKFKFEKLITVGGKHLQYLSDASSISSVNGSPLLKLDLMPYIDSLSNMNSGDVMRFEITSISHSGKVNFANVSDDQRPKIIVEHAGCDPHKDYTIAYSYSDSTRKTTYYKKIDDFFHTNSKGWTASFSGHDGRYFSEKKRFGADNRLLRSYTLIGNPDNPSRVDSVQYLLSGNSQILQTLDQEFNLIANSYHDDGEISVITASDRTKKEFLSVYQSDTTDGDYYFGSRLKKVYTDENQKKSIEYYDVFGRLRKKILDADSLNYTTKYYYDLLGNLMKVVHPNGDSTKYVYDNFNRMTKKIDANIDTISYSYSDLGQVRFNQNNEQKKNNALAYFEYDDLGRLIVSGEAKIDPIILDTRNSSNRLTDLIIPNELHYNGYNSSSDYLTVNKTIWSSSTAFIPNFWSFNSLISSKSFPIISDTLENLFQGNYLIHPVNYYDSNYTTVAPPSNFENLATFPQFVRVVNNYDKLPDRIGAIWSNFPEKAKWDSLTPFHPWDRGVRTPRNLIGKKAAVAYRDKSDEPFHYIVFSYDPRGRVQSLMRYTENLGFDAVYYTYNSSDQVLKIIVADPLRQYVTWYGYDKNGRVDSIWTALSSDSSGLGISSLHCPASLDRPDSADIVYEYDKRGNIHTLRFLPAHLTQVYKYNPRGWLDSMITAGSYDSLLFKQNFIRDSVGNILKQYSRQRLKNELVQSYTYDRLYRLTRWSDGADSVVWSYDNMGNRLSEIKNLNIETDYNYSTAKTNRLNDIDLPGNFNKYYSYNDIGSVTKIAFLGMNDTISTESFAYSSEGRVKKYVKKNFIGMRSNECYTLSLAKTIDMHYDWRYRYSPLGGREQKRLYYSPDGDSSCSSQQFYHKWKYYLLGAGGEQLAVYNGVQVSNQDTSGHLGRRVYMYPHSFITAGGMLVTLKDSTKQFNIMDNIGNVRATYILKGTNQTWKGFDYKPFGDTLFADGQAKIGYAAEERDEESRYFNFGFRQYDPLTGRFLSVDPMFEKFQFSSPYQYANNNPVSFKDPTGLAPEPEKKSKDRMMRTQIEEIVMYCRMEQQRLEGEIQRTYSDLMRSMGYTWVEAFNGWMQIQGGSETSGEKNGVRTGEFLYSNNGIQTVFKFRYNENQDKNKVIEMINKALDWVTGSPEGAEAISSYLSDGCDINVDVTLNGREIAGKYKDCIEYDFIAGTSLNIWSSKDLATGSVGCKKTGLDKGWIYIASDYLNENFSNKYYLFSVLNNQGQEIQNEISMSFSMVFSHEFKHEYDAYFTTSSIYRECSARNFTKSIYDFWGRNNFFYMDSYLNNHCKKY